MEPHILAGMAPKAILIQLLSKYSSANDLPRLKQIQNHVKYFRRKHLSNENSVEAFIEDNRGSHFREINDQNTPFHFGVTATEDGIGAVDDILRIGNGDEGSPFFIGFSSRALISNLRIANEKQGPIMMHGDVTFKVRKYTLLDNHHWIQLICSWIV